MDLDYVTAFTSFDPAPLHRWYTRRIILRFLASDRCTSILSWSLAAQSALSNYVRGDPLDPAFPPREHHGANDPPVILFSASMFRAKGGPEFLEAARRLSERYDVLFVVKADVPSEYRKKYDLPNIEFRPYKSEVLPHDEYVDRYFARADIYVYPTFLDIFGLGILDAFSVGIPVVSTDIFAVPEMVIDGKTGITIKVPHKYRWHDDRGFWNHNFALPDHAMGWAVNELVNKISAIIEDYSFRKRLGRNALREVESGKFSIRRRNKILRSAYESALRFVSTLQLCCWLMMIFPFRNMWFEEFLDNLHPFRLCLFVIFC